LLTTIDLFILKWLCQRISNAPNDPTFRAGTDEVIDAIRSISKSESFTESNAIEVVESVFALESRMTYKDLKTRTRANVLDLLQGLFLRHGAQFSRKPGVDNFVTGLIELTQFEKSPICLGVLFPLFTDITKAWASELEAKNLTEKLFGAFYRYFPIDVQRTYSQDPNVPTLDKLAILLEECITASPIYSEFAFEQLLGNLDITQAEDSKV
jgi:DNA repair/transcription protein MET18/MMS19